MENMKRFVLLLFFAAWLSALSVQAAEPAAEGVAAFDAAAPAEAPKAPARHAEEGAAAFTAAAPAKTPKASARHAEEGAAAFTAAAPAKTPKASARHAASIREPRHTKLFASGDHGSKFYRIPALVTAADGSIVAVADRRNDSPGDLPNLIDIVLRRSVDNGASWSDQIVIARHTPERGFGDAALVVDRRTGDLLCIFASGCGLWNSTAAEPMDVCIARSHDNGLSWSEVQYITPQIYGPGCDNPATEPVSGLFAASGRALQLRDGTLAFVVAAHHTGEKWPPLYNYVCISEDGGETWRMLPATPGAFGDESKIMELADGSWLMSIRNPGQGQRLHALSRDRGATWSAPAEWEDLPDPACDGDILRYSLRSEGARRDRLLHSMPADTAIRRNVSVAVSYDEGRTWPVCRCVWNVPSAYSSLTKLPDGSVGLLSEVYNEAVGGYEIWFSQIPFEWLTRGEDDGK